MSFGVLQLLQRYSVSETRRFIQFDALVGITPGKDCFNGDEDGHLICWGEAIGPMSAVSPVRVMIRPETTKQEALALLEKILETVEQCYEAEPAGEGDGVDSTDQQKRTNVIEFPMKNLVGATA